jgi:DNA mismatch endonuclease (patch repair protein)
MRAVKGGNTSPELAVRACLRSIAPGYRLHWKAAPGSPDVAYPGRRLAIFVHGCFWHGHDCARGARVPKANRDYWVGKVARNRARDAAAQERLRELGWRTLVVWECQTRDGEALRALLAGFLTHPS